MRASARPARRLVAWAWAWAVAVGAVGCTGRCDRTASVPVPAEAANANANADANADADAVTLTPPVVFGLTHPFQPMGEGDTWDYQTTQTGPAKLVTTSVERIVSVERGIDRVVARVTDKQVGGGGSSERSLIVTPEGVSPDIGVLRFAGGAVTTKQTSGVYLPIDPTRPQKKWRYTQTLSSGEITGEAEALGIETVRVPAGEYQAARVRSTIHNGAHVQHDDSWFARGVGLVKYAQSTPNGYGSEKVLVRFQRSPPAL